jgi:hypothetical protein
MQPVSVQAAATLGDAVVVRRVPPEPVCDGLTFTADALVGTRPSTSVVRVVLHNTSPNRRSASLAVAFGSRRVVVSLGSVASGATRRHSFTVHGPGAVRIGLLVGP